MNEIRKQWIAALRSGKYKQGRHYLRCDNKFCCLGVLCDVVGLEAVYDYSNRCYMYAGASSALPNGVRVAAGVAHKFGRIDKLSDEVKAKIPYLGLDLDGPLTLSSLNDSGVPFSVIADIIESEPEGLFEDE